MRAAAVLIFASACGFTIGAPVDGSLVDSADGTVDMAIDMQVDDDDDDDTIVDTVDNCPLVANTDQHDEDMDLHGDKCDVCPQVAGDADGDGDGVGDACDPNPATPGDVLVHFDGFGTAGPGLPAPWGAVGGLASDWAVIDDSLVVGSSDTARMLRMDAGGIHTTVDLQVAVSTPGMNTQSASAIVNTDDSMSTGNACSFVFGDQTRRLTEFVGSNFNPIATAMGAPVDVPGVHRVVFRIDATTGNCSFTPGGSMMVSMDAQRTHVGLRVRNLAAAYRYIAVYRSP